MVFVHLFDVVMSQVGEVGLLGHHEEILDRLLEGALVAFESQQIVAAVGDYLLGQGALAAHGINSDEAALEFQQFQ